MNDSESVSQFQQILNQASEKKTDTVSGGEAQHPVKILIDTSMMEDPSSLTPEFWEKLEKWAEEPQTQSWFASEMREGKRISYGYVTNVVESTGANTGIRRVEVKYINEYGQRMGFVYSTTSGNPEVARLQNLEPGGFKNGDVVLMEEEGSQVNSRTKVRDNDEASLAKAKILLGIKKNMSSENKQNL
jgi:hypothetical protein